MDMAIHWEGGKHAGRIHQAKTLIRVTSARRTRKVFYSDHPDRATALAAAEAIRIQWSLDECRTANRIARMTLADGTQRLLVTVTLGRVLRTDASALPEVEQYTWCAVRVRGGKYYATTTIDKKPVYFHHMILAKVGMWPPLDPTHVVDHIDNDGLNNCLSNLRVVPHRMNRRGHAKYRCNTRMNGVRRVVTANGTEYYKAEWVENDGKHVSRLFSIAKLGEEPAFEAACALRREADARLGIVVFPQYEVEPIRPKRTRPSDIPNDDMRVVKRCRFYPPPTDNPHYPPQ